MLRIAALVALSLLAAATATATAHAEERVARADVGRIDLSGEAVVYERIRDRSLSLYDLRVSAEVVRHVPGERPTRLFRLPGLFAYPEVTFGGDANWDVSDAAAMLGTENSTTEGGTTLGETTVEGGPIGRALETLSSCYETLSAPAVAVAGTTGVSSSACDDGTQVHRLDAPGSGPRTIAPWSSHLDAAGTFVAAESGGRSIDVLDARDGSLVFRASGRFLNDGNGPSAFALQDDGKLAALVRAGEGCEVVWFSPAEPFAHVLGRSRWCGDVKLADDRAVWMRQTSSRIELVATTLAGAHRVVGRFRWVQSRRGLLAGTTVGEQFAFDGERLAYSLAQCDGRRTLLLRRTLAGPRFRDVQPVRCPMRIAEGPVKFARDRRSVRVPVRCPRGCWGHFTLRGRERGFSVPSSGNRARLVLDGATRRRLRRRGSVALKVAYTPYDRVARERRSGSFTLRLSRGPAAAGR